MPDILERIDAATDNRCMCGCRTPLDPDGPSAYYVDAAHQQGWMRDQTTRPSEVHGTEFVDPDQMRWRPDLVTDADDANLLPLGSQNWYDGRYHAQVYERTNRPETWHLRLDDGHRYVGADLADVGGRQDRISIELEGRIREAWRRLERELGNTRHLVADDPWSDAMGDRLWALPETAQVQLYNLAPPFDPPSEHEQAAGWWPVGVTWQRRCRSCGQHGTPMAGRRVVYESGYLATTADRTEEFCDLCPHCRMPFPGPPISASWHLDPLSDWWRLVLRMTAGDNRLKFGYRLLVEELRNSTDPAGLIQRTWDRMEADLLRRIEQPPVINDPRQLHALLGIPIVADPSMPPGVAEIRNVNTGDTFRIHARDNQFTLTPAQQQEIRRRFAVMQQHANDLFVAFNEAYAPVIQQASQHAARIADQVSAALATTNWPEVFRRDPTT